MMSISNVEHSASKSLTVQKWIGVSYHKCGMARDMGILPDSQIIGMNMAEFWERQSPHRRWSTIRWQCVDGVSSWAWDHDIKSVGCEAVQAVIDISEFSSFTAVRRLSVLYRSTPMAAFALRRAIPTAGVQDSTACGDRPTMFWRSSRLMTG